MARPTKVEGNPDHPGSLGATDSFSQAAVLGLYDPDRSQAEIHDGRIGSWAEFEQELSSALGQEKGGRRGRRKAPDANHYLSDARRSDQHVSSKRIRPPSGCSTSRLRVTMCTKARSWRSANTRNPVYHVDQADVVVALDSDFLTSGPGCIRYAREFARKRRVEGAESKMNRLYAVESTPTSTGGMADHRLRLKAAEVEGFARLLAREIGLSSVAAPASAPAIPASWIPALVRDLKKYPGATLIVAGDQQPAIVHALAHAMNQALGNFGKTVHFTAPLEVTADNQWDAIGQLAADIRSGSVTTLLIMGSNPVYDAPADLDFKSLIPKVAFSVRLGLYEDETSALCHWHIPAAHELESWGDARGYDGTVSVIQPLIAPLYGGKSELDFLIVLNGQGKPSHEVVHGYWQAQRTSVPRFDAFWEKTLRDGVVADSALPAKQVSVKAGIGSDAPAAVAQGLEIVFRPDHTIFDGRFANNGWLQELPKPMTLLTWDSVAMVSPKTAERLGVKNETAVSS